MHGTCCNAKVVREAMSRVDFRVGVVGGAGGGWTWDAATTTHSKSSKEEFKRVNRKGTSVSPCSVPRFIPM
jgi:hypothetical protein